MLNIITKLEHFAGLRVTESRRRSAFYTLSGCDAKIDNQSKKKCPGKLEFARELIFFCEALIELGKY
jgi:hypothetical protein